MVNLLDAGSVLSAYGWVGILIVMFAETGLLIGFFLPGDTLLFTAGLLCTSAGASAHTKLSLPLVLFAAVFGALAGAQTGYVIGQRGGRALLAKTNNKHLHKGMARAEEILAKYGHAKAVVIARFVPVVRTVLNPLAGAAGVPARTFTVWQVIGGTVWSVGLVVGGYLLGKSIPNVDKYLLPIVAIILILSLIPICLELLRARKDGKQGESQPYSQASQNPQNQPYTQTPQHIPGQQYNQSPHYAQDQPNSQYAQDRPYDQSPQHIPGQPYDQNSHYAQNRPNSQYAQDRPYDQSPQRGRHAPQHNQSPQHGAQGGHGAPGRQYEQGPQGGVPSQDAAEARNAGAVEACKAGAVEARNAGAVNASDPRGPQPGRPGFGAPQVERPGDSAGAPYAQRPGDGVREVERSGYGVPSQGGVEWRSAAEGQPGGRPEAVRPDAPQWPVQPPRRADGHHQ